MRIEERAHGPGEHAAKGRLLRPCLAMARSPFSLTACSDARSRLQVRLDAPRLPVRVVRLPHALGQRLLLPRESSPPAAQPAAACCFHCGACRRASLDALTRCCRVVLLLLLHAQDGSPPNIIRSNEATHTALGISLGFFIVDFAISLKYKVGTPAGRMHACSFWHLWCMEVPCQRARDAVKGKRGGGEQG